jgi:hypothetical protein
MKATLLTILLGFGLALLIVSCGKDNGSAQASPSASAQAEDAATIEARKAEEAKKAEAAKKVEAAKKAAAARKAGGSKAGDQAAEAQAMDEAVKALNEQLKAEEATAKAKAKAEAAKAAKESKAAEAAEAAELVRLKALAVAAPTVSPNPGLYKGSVSVSLSCPTPEAKLVYTTDGSEPGPDNGKDYTGAFTITSSALLRVLAHVPKGNAAPVQTWDFTLDEICVDGGGSGDGSRTRPLGSLAKAIENARSMGINTIKLGPDPLNESLAITEPFAILGGWDRSFAKKSGKRSVINGVAMQGNGKKNPGYGLKLSGTKVNDGRFELLEVHGGESGYSAGVFLTDKTAPTFTNCAFVGGQGTYGYGALINGGAAPGFLACDLSGGAGESSYGVAVDSARVSLTACVASAGSGRVIGAGVNVTDGRISAVNSVLSGNGANSGYGLALYNSKGSKVESCTLWGGSGRDAIALFVSVGDPSVVSCILAAAGKKVSYGIYKNYGESTPAQLKSIAFAGCATGLYFDADTKSIYTGFDASGKLVTAAGKAGAKPVAEASSVEDFVLGDAPNCRTPTDAPDKIATGGLPASSGTTDVTGARRSEPWSIGAYEIDR